ncbi:hypothetical protein [Metamycoplasma orale]|uniref:Uncharacterized protein n=1 Tax=Metamycoplasma orale TaxID=2121 RepID=A0A448ZX20_METOS|nr:hypothetical protein [Metamycoplasma orale]VEU55653.1 Uncharacterised protein [Metamycoplasma orale]
MKIKKQNILFLPYWILLFLFQVYLIAMTMFLKADKNINDSYFFSTINQIFLIAPSYITQLLLLLLMLCLFLNFFLVKIYYAKRNIQLDNKQMNKLYLNIFLYSLVSLLLTFVINIIIIFNKQNYFEIINQRIQQKKLVYLHYTKAFEFLYVYIFRLIYWFGLNLLFIKITNNVRKGILFFFILIIIYLISLILGILLYQIVHDRLINYIIILLSSIFFPEIINSLYSLKNITMTMSPLLSNIYLINLVYIPAFILLIVLIAKLNSKPFMTIKIKTTKF